MLITYPFSFYRGNETKQNKINWGMQLLAVRTILYYLKVTTVWNKFPHGIIKVSFRKKRVVYYTLLLGVLKLIVPPFKLAEKT